MFHAHSVEGNVFIILYNVEKSLHRNKNVFCFGRIILSARNIGYLRLETEIEQIVLLLFAIIIEGKVISYDRLTLDQFCVCEL